MKKIIGFILLATLSLPLMAQNVDDYTFTVFDKGYVKQLAKTAKKGDVTAQRYYGICLYQGNGIKQDKEEAYHWLLLSALAGDAEATYQLAKFHQSETEIPQQNRLPFLAYMT